MYGYIYLIVNKVNGKTYVGKHKLYKRAWNKDNYMGSGKRLKPAQRKYGIENFEKFLIEYTFSEEDACKKEKFWIAEYRSRNKAEYNITDGGDGGSNKGRKFSEEHRKKIAEAMKGDQRNKGRHHTEEARRHMSEGHKGKPHSEEQKRKVSQKLKGHSVSEETRKKLSKASKGRKHSEEAKRKMSESAKRRPSNFKGKHHSEESRKKMSTSLKGRTAWNKGRHCKVVNGKRVYY